MRKLLCICVLSLFMTYVSAVNASGDTTEKGDTPGFRDLLVKELAAVSDMVRIAVLDIEGDDGTIRDSIIATIWEKTSFKIIERSDLDKLLAEQGIQFKDIIDENTKVDLGKIKGVEGLLLGKVIKAETGALSRSRTVSIKLVDVESGDIVFASHMTFSDFDLSSLASYDVKEDSLGQFREAFAKALPDQADIVRVAVLDIEGDDGTLKDTVISTMIGSSSFRVIERADLNKLLDEQGLQFKDIFDEKTKIRYGKIRGVEGLLMGKVLDMKEGFMSYNLKVYLKLVDVERGEILFAQSFNIVTVSPLRQQAIYGAAGAILLILILIIISRLKKEKERHKLGKLEKVMQEGDDARVDLTTEISKACTNIAEARSKLMTKDRSKEAVLLKGVEKDLLHMKETIEGAERGSLEMNKKNDLQGALKFDQKMMGSLKAIKKSSDRLYDLAFDGSGTDLEKAVNALQREIKETLNEYRSRKV